MMPEVKPNTYIAGYIPVIHKGYIDFFNHYRSADGIYVFDRSLLGVEDYLRKDLRALEPAEAVNIIKNAGYNKIVNLLIESKLADIDMSSNTLIMPDEDVSHTVAQHYLHSAKVDYYPVFLRWDRRNIERLNQHQENELTTKDKAAISLMNQALKRANLSSDIWRRVGAIITNSDAEIIDIAENRSLPTQFTPWIDGDVRTPSNAGSNVELNIFMHAEARIIARAAKMGIKLGGSTLYVTTFPCPACALLISESGIKNLFYKDGYAMLNGLEVMDQHGITLRRVLVNDLPDIKGLWVKYPEKSKE
jgi:dCMP deaminase